MEVVLHPMVPLPRESILSESLDPNSGYPSRSTGGGKRPDNDLNNVEKDSGGLVRGRVNNSAKIGLRSFILYRVVMAQSGSDCS